MTMISLRVDDCDADEAQRWAEELGIDRYELLQRWAEELGIDRYELLRGALRCGATR